MNDTLLLLMAELHPLAHSLASIWVDPAPGFASLVLTLNYNVPIFIIVSEPQDMNKNPVVEKAIGKLIYELFHVNNEV